MFGSLGGVLKHISPFLSPGILLVRWTVFGSLGELLKQILTWPHILTGPTFCPVEISSPISTRHSENFNIYYTLYYEHILGIFLSQIALGAHQNYCWCDALSPGKMFLVKRKSRNEQILLITLNILFIALMKLDANFRHRRQDDKHDSDQLDCNNIKMSHRIQLLWIWYAEIWYPQLSPKFAQRKY